MSSDSDQPIRIETGGTDWVATFAAVGVVRVDPAGGTSIEVSPGPEAEQRRRALEWGWAEPLSFLRKGFRLTDAVAAEPDGGRGLLLTGSSWEILPMLRELTLRGWRVLSDCLTPIRWEAEGWVAYPRSAPVLGSVGRADRWGVETEPIRTDGDVVEIPLPRATEPVAVGAVIELTERKLRDPSGVQPVTGAARLQMAAGLLQRGPGQEHKAPPSEIMVDDLRVAQLPMARLRMGDRSMAENATEALDWWAAQVR